METATQPTIKVATPPEARLRQLGLTTAADNVKQDVELARKMRIAYEFHRVVTPDNIARFNKKLEEQTRQKQGTNAWGEIITKDVLTFTPIQNYGKVPPSDVLDKLEEAMERKCFDVFEVASIKSVRVIPDPILFGVINGCEDKYFIAQWDNDVSIDQLLGEDEG